MRLNWIKERERKEKKEGYRGSLVLCDVRQRSLDLAWQLWSRGLVWPLQDLEGLAAKRSNRKAIMTLWPFLATTRPSRPREVLMASLSCLEAIATLWRVWRSPRYNSFSAKEDSNPNYHPLLIKFIYFFFSSHLCLCAKSNAVLVDG